MEVNSITEKIIGCAIKVHRALGGLSKRPTVAWHEIVKEDSLFADVEYRLSMMV